MRVFKCDFPFTFPAFYFYGNPVYAFSDGLKDSP